MLILAVLSTCSEFSPDYNKVYQKIGVSHARTAYLTRSHHKHLHTPSVKTKARMLTFFYFSQQKFKKLIESTGKYGLVNGKVVDLEEDPDNPAPPPTTPAKRGRGGKAAGTPRTTSARKRKALPPKEKADSGDEDSDAEVAETPAKKRATTKRGAAKAAAKKVKDEVSGDEDAEENGNGEAEDKSDGDTAEKSDGDSAGDVNPDEV